MRRLTRTLALLAAGGLTVFAATQAHAQVTPESGTAGPDVVVQAGQQRDLGNGITESKFVPVAPCRIYDTRNGAGRSPIGAGTFRIAKIRGPEDFGGQFAAQGGKAGGCGISPDATSVVATFTAVSPAGTGYLRAWPSGSPEPNATLLNYIRGFNPSNTATVTICNVGCGVASDLRMKAFDASTHVVIDVQGYTIKPLSAVVESSGTLQKGSRVVSTSRPFQGQYLVEFDRPVDGCSYTATVDGTSGNGYAMVGPDSADSTRVYVFTSDANGALQNRRTNLLVTC